jgi:hypothetical protein
MEESYMYKDSYTIGVIIFGSVRFLSKKVTKPNLKKKTETEPKPGQTDWFRCGSIRFFREKTDSNRFGLVFSVLAWFLLGLARFFSGFFRFRFGSVRFGFFGFLLIKPKPNQTGRFFQNFNRFNWFFFGFLGLIGFLVFLLTPTIP